MDVAGGERGREVYVLCDEASEWAVGRIALGVREKPNVVSSSPIGFDLARSWAGLVSWKVHESKLTC